MRPHIDYGDIIYDQANNESFTPKIERIQYKATFTTGAIKGKFQSKLYSELVFEFLKIRHWFKKLCTFFKLKLIGLPEYLFDLIPQTNHLYSHCLLEDVMSYNRTDLFKYFFSIYTIRMEQIG